MQHFFACCSGSTEAYEEIAQRVDSRPVDSRVPNVENSKLALKSDNWQKRKDAVSNLGLLGADSPHEVVPVLQQSLLKDEHWRVRYEVAKTFGMMGPTAVSLALMPLHEACKDSDNMVRDAAARALTTNGQPMPPFYSRGPAPAFDSNPQESPCADPVLAAAAEQEEQESPVEFWMTVSREEGAKIIGLDVDFKDGPYLKVVKLNPGIFREWNTDNPLTMIQEGDLLMEINGVRGNSQKLVSELMTAKTLHTLVRKGSVTAKLLQDRSESL